MNERRSSKLWTIAILVITGSVLAAAARQEGTVFAQARPKPEKLCPITFHLDPVTTLQAKFAADTERTNGKLATKLSEFRSSLPAHPPGTADTKLWLAHLAGEYDDAFAGTYLKAPVLAGEDGLEYKGWHNILVYLSSVIPHTTYIIPQSVNVYLEYLPLANQTGEFLHKRGVVASGFKPEEIDFLVNIRTVIAHAPYDPPMEIGNETPIPHRKVCDPIY